MGPERGLIVRWSKSASLAEGRDGEAGRSACRVDPPAAKESAVVASLEGRKSALAEDEEGVCEGRLVFSRAAILVVVMSSSKSSSQLSSGRSGC